MYTFIVRPEEHAVSEFYNKDSAQDLADYLEHDAKEREEETLFFNSERDNIQTHEMVKMIDNNVKGLKKDEEKFHSLFINPSAAELQHIVESEEKLKAYTKEVMQNYADNFNLKDGKKISSRDLVWAAVIHQDRYYTNKDEKMSLWVNDMKVQQMSKEQVVADLLKNNRFKNEENAEKRVKEFYDIGIVRTHQPKPGLNAHVHIVVSARDKAQKITLHPNGKDVKKFNRKEWSKKNIHLFNERFQFNGKDDVNKKGKKNEVWIESTVKAINTYLPEGRKIELEKVNEIGEKLSYSPTFYKRLNRVSHTLQDNKVVNDPYHVIEFGKDRKEEELKAAAFVQKSFSELMNEFDQEESFDDIVILKKKAKKRQQKR